VDLIETSVKSSVLDSYEHLTADLQDSKALFEKQANRLSVVRANKLAMPSLAANSEHPDEDDETISIGGFSNASDISTTSTSSAATGYSSLSTSSNKSRCSLLALLFLSMTHCMYVEGGERRSAVRHG
jgi:hypothetical protein